MCKSGYLMDKVTQIHAELDSDQADGVIMIPTYETLQRTLDVLALTLGRSEMKGLRDTLLQELLKESQVRRVTHIELALLAQSIILFV